MKKQGIWALVILGIIAVLVLAYFGVFQTVIYSGTSETSCKTQLNNYCSQGSYKCTSCSKSGTIWSATCFQRGSSSANSITTDACANVIIPHSTAQCYNGNVYWYSNQGVRTDLKTTCTNGCTNGVCNPPPSQKIVKCVTGTTYLCSDSLLVPPILSNGDLSVICPNVANMKYCSAGCTKNGLSISTQLQDSCAVSPPTCPNSCPKWGVSECVSKTQIRGCGLFTPSVSNCFQWSPTYSCPNGQVCTGGACVDVPKCFGSSTLCVSGYKILPNDQEYCANTKTCASNEQCRDINGVGSCVPNACKSECSSGEFPSCDSATVSKKCVLNSATGCYQYQKTTCPSGTQCIGAGSCQPVEKPCGTAGAVECPKDPCQGVVCQDKCDGTTLDSQGTCTAGSCVYGKEEVNSVQCITPPPPANGTTMCMPNSNYLCTSATQNADGTYTCPIDNTVKCDYGCSNNACNSQPNVTTKLTKCVTGTTYLCTDSLLAPPIQANGDMQVLCPNTANMQNCQYGCEKNGRAVDLTLSDSCASQKPTDIITYILGGLALIVVILIIVALVPKGKRKKK